jgi:pimeloyl-ACP methyl ester carboxylesterase
VFGGVANVAAWHNKPSWFIVASEDGAIHPDLERLMAERAKAKTTVLKSSHVAMLSHPKDVLAVILDAAQTVSK